ncbi:MAG: hypothetical protein AB7S78_01455 [Candidatus Omnitrophota bacterium]
MKKDLIILGAVILSALLFSQTGSSRVKYDRSVTVRKLPVQDTTVKSPFEYKEFKITPTASFRIEARLLGKRKYLWGKEARLAPIDFALGWGPMSNYSVLKELKISQFNRWYFYRYKKLPIMKKDIIAHSANMHLIPATDEIARKIKSVRIGEIIDINGYLVNVSSGNRWRWNSSLSRTDTGNGSCEIIWVEEMTVK